ncbi:MAG TPA: 3-deoxy-7-phosphoheptulonate synthase, partial [Solirubrobacteraceae bacterium]|nr:3-deoxy-7-phosphoheptulonate synthase [Solirubrobacteraceae bacterium]
GLSSTLEELLMAAEYVRTFETAYRFTLDLMAIPVLKEMTHLPVIVDPSHAAGRRDLVAPMSLAAAAAGADGLSVEVHPDPDQAICDAAQQLVADEFPQYLDRVRAAAAVGGEALWEEPVASGR